MAFNGLVESDFLKLAKFDNLAKPEIIDFAATDYVSLRDALIKYVQATYPLDYQNFIESDLGVMLIELVAYMGAVMSMKADLLANENYLATARNRNNVSKILELLGIKLKGPVSAAANAKLTLTSPSTEQEITIPIDARVITIASPEDGNPVTFTLYKVVNGQVEQANSNGDIVLSVSESNNTASAVWENLALLEGSLVTESGTINSTDISKSILLNGSPVVEKSISVYLTPPNGTGAPWTEIDSLFFVSGSGEQVFEVVRGNDFKSTILFGDGISGKPVLNNSTYFITYRIGGGTRGNILAETLNAPVSVTHGATTKAGTLENTSVAVGGRDAEDVEKAKKYAPLVFRSQNRLVTANDYSVFANQFAGSVGATGKARAVVRDAYSSANIIDVYILQVASNTQLQQATVEFKKQLLEAIQEKKMITDEVVIVDGVIRTLDLVMTIRIDKYLLTREEEIKGKVRARLLQFFNVDNFDFGKPLIISELNRAVFTLPEVRYATVDNLDSDVTVDFNEIIQLNNFTFNIVGV